MKLVYCLECGDIFSPGTESPKRCECGYSVAQWDNPKTGALRVSSRADRCHLKVLGLNNDWLNVALSLGNNDALHRQWNELTSDRADGYLFKTRNCPIIMIGADHGGQIAYDPDLVKQVEWYGKFDCAKKRAVVDG